MPIPVAPSVGRTARAIRFLNEPEIWVGIAVADPWLDESDPPLPTVADTNMGRIAVVESNSTVLTTGTASLRFTRDAFEGGVAAYRLRVTDANTYALYSVSNLGSETLLAGGLTPSATPRTTLVKGLSLTVTAEMPAASIGESVTYKVDGAIGFKQVERRMLCIPDADGDIDYAGGNFRSVPTATAAQLQAAYDSGARHVFVEAVLRYVELPLKSFRQSAVFTQLQPKSTVATPYPQVLLPSQVERIGAMELVVNDSVVVRQANHREFMRYVLEF